MNTPRNQTDLVVGHYQPWRTVTHCTSPEPRRFLQSGSESTAKKTEGQSTLQCIAAHVETPKAGSPKPVFQPLRTQGLLEFDFRASFFKLLLGGFSVSLWSGFFDCFWSTVHQVLGFFEAQAGDFAHSLDD